MPILRLRKHQANFSDEDILINPSDFPGLRLNDVVELKPPKGGVAINRILLQVRKWPETNQSYPNCVSIKDSVVNTHLQLYADVLVNVVDKKDVLVDSIEVCFGNAYLARSYMWGLRNHLNNRCVYQRQKLDYLNIRSQICEIWAQGNKVTSGYVDDDTKTVFRSASSLVYLFIQMSSEMWDYDINGDLYCEKTINGFLTDLFETWRRNDCSHDITIVLFSRTFYDAESLEEFPEEMRECLQVDYKGRFYEDCYRVAFQNDRFDLHDWNVKLTALKSLFNQYQKEVIDRHQKKYDNTKIPRAYNSSASQGNFLEVLNMSLNVFEKHYFDRSFDRTGQLSVVVSPGVGVFEVDFEMTNLTKQRIIDNGIGSDLVCLGEQPLHTVPLLKFNSKSSQLNDNLATCDVYNMPHWINLSFYSSQNQVFYSNFIPRIKLPTLSSGKLKNDPINGKLAIVSASESVSSASRASGQQRDDQLTASNSTSTTPNNNTIISPESISFGIRGGGGDNNQLAPSFQPRQGQPYKQQQRTNRNNGAANQQQTVFSAHAAMPDLVDYDDFDAQVFKPNSVITYHCQQQMSRLNNERPMLTDLDQNVEYVSDNDEDAFLERDNRNKSANIQRRSSDVKNYQEYSRNMMKRQITENLPIVQTRAAQKQIQTTFTRMSLVDSYLTDVKIKPESADDLSVRGYNVQSSRLSKTATRPKALINPFDPSHMTIKLTPNRRRWTHVFPQGPTGTFIQQHHYQPLQRKSSNLPYLADVTTPPAAFSDENDRPPFSLTKQASTAGGSIAPMKILRSAHDYTRTAGGAGKVDLSKSSPKSSLNQHKSTLVSNDTIRFAWCASGEQEWTPAITTGVDWKSLTMPACLPLTTDFFPSKTSLQNDYVIGEYNIDSSCIHSRYSIIEVYRELVCQRLQKGFQIILLPRQTTSSTTSPSAATSSRRTASSSTSNATSNHKHHHHHHHHSHHNHSSSRHGKIIRSSTSSIAPTSRHATSPSTPSTTCDSEIERERTEYTMSIGRIFHKLTLNGNTITVTQYRPRHPYPTIKIDYCYRFRAPFHETYGQSWVHFKSEKLENYSWNYLDNYICARGESFELRSSLKFWRFRILILPSKLCLSKRVSARANKKDAGDKSEREEAQQFHDVHNLEFSIEERDALMESFVKLLEIINKTRRASSFRFSNNNSTLTGGSCGFPSNSSSSTSTAGSAVSAPQTPKAASKQQTNQNEQLLEQTSSPTRLNVQIGAKSTDNSSSGVDQDSLVAPDFGGSNGQLQGLQFESINMDIDSALRDAKRAEWVHVQYHNFYDVNQAFELVIKWMVASGAGIAEMVQGWSRKVGNSSVHVVPIPWEPFAMPHSGKADPLRCPLNVQLDLCCLPASSNSLDDNQVLSFQEMILRRYGFLRFHDLISTENIERQYVHMSGFAVVALPNVVGDDSVAATGKQTRSASPRLTRDDKSNEPQRQPLLISVKSPSAWPTTRQASQAGTTKVASSGKPIGNGAGGPSLRLTQQDTVSSPHEEYITRHIGGARQNKANRVRGESEQIEFIWSWNYMLTKRWRSPSTQDESYAVSLLQDFRAFCQNSDGRLLEFWLEVSSSIISPRGDST